MLVILILNHTPKWAAPGRKCSEFSESTKRKLLPSDSVECIWPSGCPRSSNHLKWSNKKCYQKGVHIIYIYIAFLLFVMIITIIIVNCFLLLLFLIYAHIYIYLFIYIDWSFYIFFTSYIVACFGDSIPIGSLYWSIGPIWGDPLVGDLERTELWIYTL